MKSRLKEPVLLKYPCNRRSVRILRNTEKERSNHNLLNLSNPATFASITQLRFRLSREKIKKKRNLEKL